MPIQEVVHLTREYGDLLGAGGVRENSIGICTAAAKLGMKTHVFLPHPNNSTALAGLIPAGAPLTLAVRMDFSPRCPRTETVEIQPFVDAGQANLLFYLVAAQRFRYLPDSAAEIERRGIYTYTAAEAELLGRPDLYGKRYHDNFELNVLLIKAALHALKIRQIKPDLIHCHDSHTALLPFLALHSQDGFAEYLAQTPALVTVYNAADRYRGEVKYEEWVRSVCGIHDYLMQACLHNNQFDPVLAAALAGATINVPSENYARELQQTGLDWTTCWLGHKLAGLGLKLEGITSGINPDDYNPENYQQLHLPAGFSPRNKDYAGKQVCKAALLQKYNLSPNPAEAALFTFVGRLVHQKGYDVLSQAVRRLFTEDQEAMLVGHGSGHKDVVLGLKALEAEFPGRVLIDTVFDPHTANQIYAAGDFFLVPSRYEPCGLTDFIAQLFGNIPIVHAVGGLVKVIDGDTGLTYRGGVDELLAQMRRALVIYRHQKDAVRTMQEKAVANIYQHFTWEQVFETKYLPLYLTVVERAKPALPY